MDAGTAGESKLNICMLLPFLYEPNRLVYSKIRMAGYLTRLGHRVTWIVSSEGDQGSGQSRLDDVELCTIRYRRFFPGTSIPARLFNRIPNLFIRMRSVLRIFRDGRYDLIVVQPDAFDALAAASIKRRYKVPFVLDLPNPIETMDVPVHGLWRRMEVRFNEFAIRRLLPRADLILAISALLKDDLVKRRGIPEPRIMLVPEGVNHELFSPQQETRGMEKARLCDCGVVIYEGTLSKHRGLSLLIEAFSKVKMRRTGVKLLMVGEGDDGKNLRGLAQELGMGDDVIFTGQVPQAEVPGLIAVADVGVSPVRPLAFYRFSSPTKMFEYMAMAKPVVANMEIPEQEDVLAQSGGGIPAPFTSDAFAEAIVALLDDPQKAAEMGRMGRRWVVANRSHEVMARQLEARYLELVRAGDS